MGSLETLKVRDFPKSCVMIVTKDQRLVDRQLDGVHFSVCQVKSKLQKEHEIKIVIECSQLLLITQLDFAAARALVLDIETELESDDAVEMES